MANSQVAMTEGSGKNAATYSISEGTTKEIQRMALNTNAGVEIGTSAAPVQVTLANTGVNATAVKVDGSAATQPVSLTSTTITGTVAVTESGTWSNRITDGTNTAAVKAASTAPVATDPAFVVTLSPNGLNANGQTTMANSAPVVIASNQSSVKTVTGGSKYETVAVSQANQALGATGAAGDYLEALICVVATAATSQVQLKDGSNTAFTVLPNAVGAGIGTYYLPFGLISTSGAWQVTTAAGVTVIGTGDFT